MTPLSLTLLFLSAAALSLCSAAAGGFFALWVAHCTRTGVHPLPSIPRITLWGRRHAQDEEDEDEPTNGRATAPRRVGP